MTAPPDEPPVIRIRPTEISIEELRSRQELAGFLLRCSPEDFEKMAALMAGGGMTGLEAFEAVRRGKQEAEC